jgi:hypothetical protein
MLAHVILNQEVPMNEQGHLFGPRPCVWVELIWDRSPAAVRRECIAILAEMGRATLTPPPARPKAVPTRPGKQSQVSRREVRDER